jgi:hypothetical protein
MTAIRICPAFSHLIGRRDGQFGGRDFKDPVRALLGDEKVIGALRRTIPAGGGRPRRPRKVNIGGTHLPPRRKARRQAAWTSRISLNDAQTPHRRTPVFESP